MRLRSGWYLSVLLLLTASAIGQTRAPGESARDFASRNAPTGGELTHSVIEAKPWATRETPLIAFYEEDFRGRPGLEGTGARGVRAVLFVPDSSNKYSRVDIGVIEPEGGNPRVESVFFSRVGGTARPALFTLVSWDQNHAVVKGRYHAAYAYEYSDDGSRWAVRLMKDLSAKLEGGCECWHEGEPQSHSRFRNAAELRSLLRKMGVQ